MKKMKTRKAFTVVEMVVVIAVIAILSAALIPTIGGIIRQAKVSTDTQNANHFTTQLRMYKGAIAGEEDLRAALDDLFEVGFFDSLAPESAEWGYHYWYRIEDKTVVLDTYDNLVEATAGRSQVYRFSNESPRSGLVPGYYLMDRGGSEVAALLTDLDNATNLDGYRNVLQDMNKSGLTKYDEGLREKVYTRLQNMAVFNAAGMFAPGSDPVSEVYIVSNAGVLGGGKFVIGGGEANLANILSIELPRGVKVGSNALTGFKEDNVGTTWENTAVINVNAKESELLNAEDPLFYAYSTNCVIQLSNGEKYVIIEKEIYKLPVTVDDVTGEITTPPAGTVEFSKPVADFDIICAEDGNGKVVLINTDPISIFASKDQTVFNLTATGFVDENGISVPSGAITWTSNSEYLLVDADGKVTVNNLVPVPDGDLLITATTASGNKSVSVSFKFVQLNNATVNMSNGVQGVTLELNNTNMNNFIELNNDGENVVFTFGSVNVPEGGYSTTVDGVACDTTLSFEYDTTDPLFSIADNKLTLLKLSGEQTLTIKVGNSISKTFTIKVNNVATCAVEHKFPNTGAYLYRVGNGNAIKLQYLFKVISGREVDSSKVTVKIYDMILSAQGYLAPIGTNEKFTATYTPNTSDWSQGTIQFNATGVGVARIDIATGESDPISLFVEVVNGKNITSADTSFSGNAVLLEDIVLNAKRTITNGTLYGNGFTIDASAYHSSEQGLIVISGKSAMDHVRIIGGTYSDVVFGGNDYYNSLVMITGGECTISNSYLYGCRTPLWLRGGELELVNTTLDGGVLANLFADAGQKLVLDNVTTKQVPRKADSANKNVVGAGVYVSTTSLSISIKGELKQYNWISSQDLANLPTEVKTVLSGVFSDDYASFHHKQNDERTKVVNAGFVFTSDPGSRWDASEMTSALEYDDFQISSATVYSPKNTASADLTSLYTVPADLSVDYSGAMVQGPVVPVYSFDFTKGEYKLNANDNTEYYYYDSTTGMLMVGVIEDNKLVIQLDNRVTVKKYDNFTLPVSVTIKDPSGNVVDGFTGKGEYTIIYSYTDPYQYDQNGNQKTAAFAESYTQEVKVTVSVISLGTKPADFIFANGKGTTSVEIGGVTYVMPDVSSADGKAGGFGQMTNGVYYPIVKGEQNTDGGDGTTLFRYYYLFAGITIQEYSGQTASDKYNSSTRTKPTNLVWVSSNLIYGDRGDKASTTKLEPGSVTEAVYSNKLGYKSSGYNISSKGTDCPESLVVLEFKYTDNSGKTCSYYIGYYFEKKAKCITPDSLITLADGTQVRVDSLTGTEKLLVWNLETGRFDAAPIMFVDSDKAEKCEIIHLYFSDGTDVKVIGEHGFWDYDLNRYVYLDRNASQYIGHWFAKQNGDTLTKVQLTDVVLETEVTTAWSPVTEGHLCYFVNGMLSMPGGVAGLFNIFEVDPETMTYDYEAMARDIETYGLFTYEELNAIVPLSEEMFNMAGGAYLKISIGKGNMTMDELVSMIHRYSVFFG